MAKKNSSDNIQTANEQLTRYIEEIIRGDYNLKSPATFENPAVAAKINELVQSMLSNNNNFVMRLNESMARIGDSSCVKVMMEQVGSQDASLDNLRTSSKELEESVQSVQSAVTEIKQSSENIIHAAHHSGEVMQDSIRIVDESTDMIHQINDEIREFRDKAVQINEIIDLVRKVAKKSSLLALNASIEAARAGEAGKGFGVVAQQIGELSSGTTKSADDAVRYVNELMNGIQDLADRIQTTTDKLRSGSKKVHESVTEVEQMNLLFSEINAEVEGIYDEINTQTELIGQFINGISSIADSYDTLAGECMDTGKHLYNISRDIDRARSDMARYFAKLYPLDWIKVYEIDHLIFTWRTYNNIAEYEHLKLEQVNNPKGCKFGKWVTDPANPIAGSTALREAAALHEELHRHAVDAWHAKDGGDISGAMAAFARAHATYERFVRSLEDVRNAIRATGATKQTETVIINM